MIIYTTIGGLTQICPHKSVLKIWPISTRALAIRHRSSRRFLCASATFGPPFVFYCPFFLRKNFNNVAIRHRCDFLDAIFTLHSSRRCRHRRLLKSTHNCAQLRTTTHNYAQLRTTTHNYAQLRTTTHNCAQLCTLVYFIVLSNTLVFMVLGVSYSQVLYNN